MSNDSRRKFLSSSVKFLVGSAALTSIGAHAGSHEHHAHGGEGDGMPLEASVINTCGTCEYWGGMRKASKDKTMVKTQSMGWCNNPDSMNYQKLTSADHVMKKTGMWKKWSALEI